MISKPRNGGTFLALLLVGLFLNNVDLAFGICNTPVTISGQDTDWEISAFSLDSDSVIKGEYLTGYAIVVNCDTYPEPPPDYLSPYPPEGNLLLNVTYSQAYDIVPGSPEIRLGTGKLYSYKSGKTPFAATITFQVPTQNLEIGTYFLRADVITLIGQDPNDNNNLKFFSFTVAPGCVLQSSPSMTGISAESSDSCTPPDGGGGDATISPPPGVVFFGLPGLNSPTLSPAGATKVNVSWSSPTLPQPICAILCYKLILTGYQIQWSTDSSFPVFNITYNCPDLSGRTWCQVTSSSVNALTIPLNWDLQPGTWYYFRIRGVYQQCYYDYDKPTYGCDPAKSITNLHGNWSSVSVIRTDRPPHAPSSPSPGDGTIGILTSVMLSWTGGDPDGDTVVYDVYLGTDRHAVDVRSATKITVSTTTASSSSFPFGLSNCTPYYWKVVARDIYGVETHGPVWSFTTVCPPTAAILTDETFGRYPLTLGELKLEAAADTGRTIQALHFSFGDGATFDGGGLGCTLAQQIVICQIPTHIYSSPGTYTATLVVTDDQGQIGSASIPVNVTANVGNEFEIKANVSSLAAGGFNHVDAQYLIAWGQNNDIYGKILRASTDTGGGTTGVTVVRDTFLISQSVEVLLNPAVAFDGVRYLVAWTEQKGPIPCGLNNTFQYSIRGRFLDTGGNPYGAEFDIVSRDCDGFSVGQAVNPQLAYANGKYFMVFQSGATFSGSFESKSSGFWPGNTFIVPPQTPADPPVIGPGVGLDFPIQNNPITGLMIPIGPPGLASDGTSFLVVANADCSWGIGSCDLYGIRVDTAGNKDEPFIIATDSGGSAVRPSLTFTSGFGYYLVVWDWLGIQAAVVDPLNPSTKVRQGPFELIDRPDGEGVLCDNTGQCYGPISTHIESAPVVAFDGLHFFVVWLDGCKSFASYSICPEDSPEELRGFRIKALDASEGYLRLLDRSDMYGIPVSCTTVDPPECNSVAKPYKPEMIVAPGPTFVPASITPQTFNMLVVWPDIRDAVANELGYTGVDIWAVMTHAATPVVQPLIRPSPPPVEPVPGVDLSVGGFSMGPVILQSGTTISIESTIRNDGTEAAGLFEVRYYWSTALPVTTGSLLYTQTFPSGLGAGASMTQSFTVTPASGDDGTYYLGVIVDASDQVAETRELNNTSIFALSVDNTAPVASILYPQSGNSVGGQALVTVSAQDTTGVAFVEFYLDGVRVFSDIGGPSDGWTMLWDTTTVANGSHTLVVRAYDAAGNVGSSPDVVIQVDNTIPTTPSNLTAMAVSSRQINLSWTASTDNVGVTGYRVERCDGSKKCTGFAQIATTASTNYSDTGLSPNTIYRYRVQANDGAGNLSAYSVIVTATTPADTTAPTAPTGLTATAVSSSQINLSWTASTDNVGVSQYRIERCQEAGCTNFTQIATTTTTSYTDTGLLASTSYSYQLQATDAAGNLSAYSVIVTATTPADTTAPTAPTGLTATAVSSSQINLSWTASTDNVGVSQYRIERCQEAGCTNFTQIATTMTTSYTDTGLLASTSYSYQVRATDAAGNLSAYSNTVSSTTPVASGVDMVMLAVSGPASAALGSSMTISDTVKNLGTENAGDKIIVGLYLSVDTTITTGDIFLGQRWVGRLKAGQSSSGSSTISIPSGVAAGTYYLGAIADYTERVAEGNENNNARVGNTITINP